MRKSSRVPWLGSLQAFRLRVGVLAATATWEFLTQRLNSLVAVWGWGVCSRLGRSVCSPGQGTAVGYRGDSRTAWQFCLF